MAFRVSCWCHLKWKPHPCAFYGDSKRQCSCSVRQIENYRQKVSGPLLDRIDIHVEVPQVDFREITSDVITGESSAVVRERVAAARDIQVKSFKAAKLSTNAAMGAKQVRECCQWFVSSDWLGKERDCVNIFALQYLAHGIADDAAIRDLRQIRIESAVMQPVDRIKFPKTSAPKDLVIWDGPLDTTWDANWNPVHAPRTVVEWKASRTGRCSDDFNKHDVEWLIGFTKEQPRTFGFLVSTHASATHRRCAWAQVRGGTVGKRKIVEKYKSV